MKKKSLPSLSYDYSGVSFVIFASYIFFGSKVGTKLAMHATSPFSLSIVYLS